MIKYRVFTNPNKDIVNQVRQSLKDNDNYCPCRIDRVPNNICMCKEFRDQKSTGYCICGLYYKVPNYKYVAVDFDGTITKESSFPNIGEPNLNLINKLRLMHFSGSKIILHTCRENGEIDKDGNPHNYLDEALIWCKEHDVPIDAVNENPWVPFGGRKIYADIYIDDRGVNVNDIERL